MYETYASPSNFVCYTLYLTVCISNWTNFKKIGIQLQNNAMNINLIFIYKFYYVISFVGLVYYPWFQQRVRGSFHCFMLAVGSSEVARVFTENYEAVLQKKTLQAII
jgi:hypothetical protein